MGLLPGAILDGATVIQGASEKPPRIRTEPPPDPLPALWARTLANDIAAALRRGWRSHSIKRAISSTGAPITGRDYTPSSPFTPPTPTSELVSHELYAWGLTDPIPTLEVPAMLWHLTQLDLAETLNASGLMKHAHIVDAWLRHKAVHAPRPASVYLLKPNRHGKLLLRRNSDYTPPEVVEVFDAAARTATVTIPNPEDLDDRLAEFERISLEQVLSLVS